MRRRISRKPKRFGHRSELIVGLLGGVATLAAVAAFLPGALGAYSAIDRSVPAPLADDEPRVRLHGPASRMRLGDGSVAVVDSVLKVDGPMRHGQFVWDERDVPAGPVWIRADLRRQIISVFRSGHEIGTAVILYGADDKPTPPGLYAVRRKLREHRSSLYDAEMPFTLALTDDGIAIHASSVSRGSATHGCIGVPEAFARKLFDAAGLGTKVFIEA